MKIVSRFFPFLSALLLFLHSTTALAQLTTGNVFITVEDSQGSGVPGVTVELTSNAGGAPKTQITDVQGMARFLNLDPGSYMLTAELEGFVTVKQSVSVYIGRTQTVPITLQPAPRSP